MNKHNDLERIWSQVPPDYYQRGVKNNILQRIWHTRKFKKIVKVIDDYPTPLEILDVGCASGWFLSKISEKYKKAQAIGIDVYEDAIKYGNKTYKNLEFRLADAHKIPFKNNQFDVVICAEVLEHVLDPKTVLKEIKRVMTRDGIAVIEMDSGNLLFSIVWFWWTNLRHGVWHDAHIQIFNSKKLERAIVSQGFKIEKKVTFNCSMAVLFVLKK